MSFLADSFAFLRRLIMTIFIAILSCGICSATGNSPWYGSIVVQGGDTATMQQVGASQFLCTNGSDVIVGTASCPQLPVAQGGTNGSVDPITAHSVDCTGTQADAATNTTNINAALAADAGTSTVLVPANCNSVVTALIIPSKTNLDIEGTLTEETNTVFQSMLAINSGTNTVHLWGHGTVACVGQYDCVNLSIYGGSGASATSNILVDGGLTIDNGASTGGNASSISSTTMVDSTASWTTNQWVGEAVNINGTYGIITSNNATTLTMSAGWVDGTPAPGIYGIGGLWPEVVVSSSNVWLSHLTIKGGTAGNGFSCDKNVGTCGVGGAAYNDWADHLTITGNIDNGFSFYGGVVDGGITASNISVPGTAVSVVSDSGQPGVSSGITISNNAISGNGSNFNASFGGSCGLSVASYAAGSPEFGVIIANNTLSYDTSCGMLFENASTISISGNIFYKDSGPGIVLADAQSTSLQSQHFTITGNKIIDEGQTKTSGTSSSTTSSTLVDSSASWKVNQFGGMAVISGSSFGWIASNTSTTLTINPSGWFNGTPSASQSFTINPGIGIYFATHGQQFQVTGNNVTDDQATPTMSFAVAGVIYPNASFIGNLYQGMTGYNTTNAASAVSQWDVDGSQGWVTSGTITAEAAGTNTLGGVMPLYNGSTGANIGGGSRMYGLVQPVAINPAIGAGVLDNNYVWTFPTAFSVGEVVTCNGDDSYISGVTGAWSIVFTNKTLSSVQLNIYSASAVTTPGNTASDILLDCTAVGG